ncbi:MAG: hypothetical protein ACYSX0_17515, partial [Planctomycetota bacterium]
MEYAWGALGGLVFGFIVGRFLYSRYLTTQESDARARREEILSASREEADRVVKEGEVRARDEIVTRREE